MKTLLFMLLSVLSTQLSAQVIQFDYTLLNGNSLLSGTSSADGRLAFDMDTGIVVQNNAEFQSDSLNTSVIADFSSQHISRLEFSDGLTQKFWDHRFDGSLNDSAAFSSSNNPFVSIKYFEGGSLLLDFGTYGTTGALNSSALMGVMGGGYVSDPTQASIFLCGGFGTCHNDDMTKIRGGISTLTVSYPNALVSSVPVPSSLWFFVSGIMGLIAVVKRKQGEFWGTQYLIC